MESDDGDSDYDEPVQILYDIVPYREWEQEPEVNHVYADLFRKIRMKKEDVVYVSFWASLICREGDKIRIPPTWFLNTSLYRPFWFHFPRNEPHRIPKILFFVV